MHDLNLTLFYKTSFQIRSVDNDGDALWSLICNIKKWMTQKWQKRGIGIPQEISTWSQFKNGSTINSDDPAGTVSFYSSAYWDNEAVSYWACSITETEKIENYAPRQWVTEIGFTYSKSTYGTVSIVLSYGDRPGYLGECQDSPKLSIPGLVPRLANDNRLICELCGRPLSLEPQILHVGEFQSFWNLISDESRDVPIIYISPKRNIDNGQYVIDPETISQSLGPSALVFYSIDPEFSDEMRANLPDERYKCYNGFVRVYASNPKIKDEGDSGRHRYFPPSAIEKMGEENFVRMLRRALAQDVYFYENMVRLDIIKTKVRRNSITKHADTKVKLAEEESFDLLTELEKELIDTQHENEQLKRELQESQSKNYALEARNKTVENALNGIKNSSIIEEIDIKHYSPRVLCELFETIYGDRIAFTDRAKKSLDECSTKPDVLWNALYDLCTLAYELHMKQGDIDIAKEFSKNSEFEYSRGAGMMTRKDAKLLEQYKDIYHGREIDTQTHIKKGTKETSDQFIRLYFGIDQKSKKLVISFVGKHLDTYSTRFLK